MLRVGVKRSYNSSSGSIIEEYFTPAEVRESRHAYVILCTLSTASVCVCVCVCVGSITKA